MGLLNIVYGFCGVLMFATILDWFDRKAVRLNQGEMLTKQWFSWVKRKTRDRETGLEFEYYLLVIRLPSYAWDYKINIDDFGWCQNAIVWYSRDPNPGYPYTKAGFSVQHLEPM